VRQVLERGALELTTKAAELLRKLTLLSRTERDPDSREDPFETRKARLLELRKRLVHALRLNP
jgi:hypothetical protein